MAFDSNDVGMQRALKILFAIIERPNHYTRRMFKDIYGTDESRIKKYFEEIKNAGFELDRDERSRYYLVPNKIFDELISLLVFSPKEEQMILEGLKHNNTAERDIEKIKAKLPRLYDVTKFHHLINQTTLTVMDILETAKREKKVVILKNYPSTSSNTVKDRYVEAFHIAADEDTVQVYELENKKVQSFNISRITKIEMTEIDWTKSGSHNIVITDCFWIQEETVKVRFRMKLGAYNFLIQKYPKTRALIKPVPNEKDTYDFEGRVNGKFKELTNFILGHHQDIIEISEPDSLINHIQNQGKLIWEKKF